MMKKFLFSVAVTVAAGVVLKVIDKALATKYSDMDIKDGEAVEKEQKEDPKIVKRIKEYAGKLAEQIVLHEKEINAILSVGKSVLAVIISLFILRNSIKGNSKFQSEVLKQLKDIKEDVFLEGQHSTYRKLSDLLKTNVDANGFTYINDHYTGNLYKVVPATEGEAA